MFTSPRIVAMDDNEDHLKALVRGLHRKGIGCLPIKYPDELENLKSCSTLRVLFTDLHLLPGGNDHSRQFGELSGLIESTFKPSGPYFIVLWTAYPDQADGLHHYMKERLGDKYMPFDIIPLDKADYINAQNVLNEDKLIGDIGKLVEESPAFSALMNWEEWILAAAGSTAVAIRDLVSVDDRGEASLKVAGILKMLSEAAVGRCNVNSYMFAAVNQALLPILSDKVSSTVTRDDGESIWSRVFDQAEVSEASGEDIAAELNRMFHVDLQVDTDDGATRGAVVPLKKILSYGFFESRFGLEENVAAERQFGCRGFRERNSGFQWVLVQAQAACDYAQKQPGPLPYYLGLDFSPSNLNHNTPPMAMWKSPVFQIRGGMHVLTVNTRFQMSLTSERARVIRPMYRLREQLLTDLLHKIHTYGSRPGMISFR